jgi:hypothetical protein
MEVLMKSESSFVSRSILEALLRRVIALHGDVLARLAR